MLGRLWKWFKRIVFIVGVALTFFVILEVIRAYQTLNDLHPWAGYAFLFILLAGLLWLGFCCVLSPLRVGLLGA